MKGQPMPVRAWPRTVRTNAVCVDHQLSPDHTPDNVARQHRPGESGNELETFLRLNTSSYCCEP